MRADYEDTSDFVDMAKKMFQPLMDDEERRKKHSEVIQKDFEEQLRLLYFLPGVLGLHINRPDMSLPNCKQSTEMLQARLGPDSNGRDQSISFAWNELGNAYLQNNDTAEAERCFRKSLNSLAALGDSGAHLESVPQISLGFALWQQRRLNDAADVFQNALDLRERDYGKHDTISFA